MVEARGQPGPDYARRGLASLGRIGSGVHDHRPDPPEVAVQRVLPLNSGHMSHGQIDRGQNDHWPVRPVVVRYRHRFAPVFGLHSLRHQSECVNIGSDGRMSRLRRLEVAHMRGRKNPPLEIVPVPEGAPLTFDTMAQAYLEDYVLQRYRTLTTARARVEHL